MQSSRLHHFWQRSYRLVRYYIQDAIKKIRSMDMYEQYFVIYGMIVTVLVIFSPIMILSPNDPTQSSHYIFLIGTMSFFKSTLVILASLIVLILWHLSTNWKAYIMEYLWFSQNPYIFSAFCLLVATASVMGLGETVSLLRGYTTMLAMTTMYYVIQIMLIIAVGYCIFMVIYARQGWFSGHVVGYVPKQKSAHRDESLQGLFDEK